MVHWVMKARRPSYHVRMEFHRNGCGATKISILHRSLFSIGNTLPGVSNVKNSDVGYSALLLFECFLPQIGSLLTIVRYKSTDLKISSGGFSRIPVFG